jgi:hypothetical protein
MRSQTFVSSKVAACTWLLRVKGAVQMISGMGGDRIIPKVRVLVRDSQNVRVEITGYTIASAFCYSIHV